MGELENPKRSIVGNVSPDTGFDSIVAVGEVRRASE
jgi:hypothetical protein